MNSEELELSLRSEFENYLKSFRAEMRQEAAELQQRLAEVFEAYAARFDSGPQPLDEAFTSTVTEHLRLARDEGAKLTATALAEAEQMEREQGGAPDFGAIRDAVADISSQTSQSAILKSLITQAAQFAPRGALFIVKSDNFVGWRTFGTGTDDSESAVRDIHFASSADTILARAIISMSTVDSAYGAHQHDNSFLEPLQFGQPDRMYAIPLIARGRGVAVMYADYGADGTKINIEALETLVRVAALTVEMLAASQTARAEGRETGSADFERAQHDGVDAAPAPQFVDSAPSAYYADEAPVAHYEEAPAMQEEAPAAEFAFSESPTTESAFEPAPAYHEEPAAAPEFEPTQEFGAADMAPAESEVATFEPAPEPVIEYEEPEAPAMDFGPEPPMAPSMEPAPSPFETAAQPEPAGVGVLGGGVVAERGIEVSPASAGRGRLRDRHVDLPIDVEEDERRLHNDARRFARLLVSEIKLYNEKKVQEGRLANDLYERLREAIDRSREMYDKRVQPPVAAKFDYFHYELVNALADGNAERLGSSYPGSAV